MTKLYFRFHIKYFVYRFYAFRILFSINLQLFPYFENIKCIHENGCSKIYRKDALVKARVNILLRRNEI